jgi:hypothetical protein
MEEFWEPRLELVLRLLGDLRPARIYQATLFDFGSSSRAHWPRATVGFCLRSIIRVKMAPCGASVIPARSPVFPLEKIILKSGRCRRKSRATSSPLNLQGESSASGETRKVENLAVLLPSSIHELLFAMNS